MCARSVGKLAAINMKVGYANIVKSPIILRISVTNVINLYKICKKFRRVNIVEHKTCLYKKKNR